MLSHPEMLQIEKVIKPLTRQQLRDRAYSNLAISRQVEATRKKSAELGLSGWDQYTSVEWYIDQRLCELIGKSAKNEISETERREFVELQIIRSELMVPEFARTRKRA